MKKKVDSKTGKFYDRNLIKTYLANNGFTSSEILRIMNPKAKKRRAYTHLELCHGLVLYSQCRRSYKYLLDQKLCVLPKPSTLVAWKSKLKFKTGIQGPVLQLLKHNSVLFEKESDRNVSLMFDEMDIKQSYSYDSRNKIVLFPESCQTFTGCDDSWDICPIQAATFL